MLKHTIEVSPITLGDKVYIPIAVRRPIVGDKFISIVGNSVVLCTDSHVGIRGIRIIVKPYFAWPAWLKARWIFRVNGQWWAVKDGNRPVPSNTHSRGECFNSYGSDLPIPLDSEFMDFTPPEVESWKDSLFENPNYKSCE